MANDLRSTMGKLMSSGGTRTFFVAYTALDKLEDGSKEVEGDAKTARVPAA